MSCLFGMLCGKNLNLLYDTGKSLLWKQNVILVSVTINILSGKYNWLCVFYHSVNDVSWVLFE